MEATRNRVKKQKLECDFPVFEQKKCGKEKKNLIKIILISKIKNN